MVTNNDADNCLSLHRTSNINYDYKEIRVALDLLICVFICTLGFQIQNFVIIYQIYEAGFITNHLTLTSCGKVYGATLLNAIHTVFSWEIKFPYFFS